MGFGEMDILLRIWDSSLCVFHTERGLDDSGLTTNPTRRDGTHALCLRKPLVINMNGCLASPFVARGFPIVRLTVTNDL